MATHYLRDKKNNTIVDVETTSDDISSVVCIRAYSNFLIGGRSKNYYHTISTIQDFDDLQELRAEWHEQPHQDETPHELVKRRLQEVAERHDLYYVTD